jgi:hypothetical protein
LTGAGAALPIVARFLAEATSDAGWGSFEVPDGISEGYVTLADAGWGSDCGSREIFLEGTEPSDGGCDSYELPRWEAPRDWTGELRRQAARLLQGLIGERRHSQR